MKLLEFFKTDDEKINLEVTLEGETVWLNLEQITELFERDKSVISRHIKNIFVENELDRNSVVAKNATTANDFILKGEQSLKQLHSPITN